MIHSLHLTSLALAVALLPDITVAEVFRLDLPLSAPRSRDPVLGGPRDRIWFQLTVPNGLQHVRGAVCNPFSRDEPLAGHWQAACKHWQFAFVQTDFDGAKKEAFDLLPAALSEFARRSGHAEVERLPLCFTGMSRGGGMSMQLAELLPQRTIACVPVCLEVGPQTEAAFQIPVLTVFGEKDGSQMDKLLGKLPTSRRQGARFSIAVQWGRKHEFGQANNLSFVWLDEVIARRLSSGAHRAPGLDSIPLEAGWLSDPATWGKDGRLPEIHAWRDYQGPREQACWFPSQRVAAVWQAFVAGTREIAITEPSGLGDGQKFVSYSAKQPLRVSLTLEDDLRPVRVALWDAHQALAERTASPWSFEVALKPGIHSLFASVDQPGQPRRVSRPHTIVVTE